MQSKIESFIEAWINILIGYVVSLVAQLFIFPLYGIRIPIHDNLMIGVWFTLVSLARSYCIRRVFNARLKSKMRVR